MDLLLVVNSNLIKEERKRLFSLMVFSLSMIFSCVLFLFVKGLYGLFFPHKRKKRKKKLFFY